MDVQEKEVYFNIYCETCKHQFSPEVEEPCNECLENGVNIDSHKPVKWEAKE